MIAKYDLRHQSATFEFFNWLVLVAAKGATKIIIDKTQAKTKKIPRDMVMQRHDNILVPGCALAGLPYCRIDANPQVTGRAPELLDWVNAGNSFPRLLSVKKPVDVKYTVTLRKNPTAPCRNSNELTWRQFAKEIDAVVIEDYADKPIHLHDRMALYAGAKMNFGVCNGPVAMIGLTPYPVAMFVNSDSARNSQLKDRIALEQERFPWMLPTQRLVWKTDTIENLLEAVE